MFCSKVPVRREKVPYWDFLKLRPGEVFKGWIAGPIVWVEGHFTTGFKGCRRSITDGAMGCAFCESGWPAKCVGYVPLWDHCASRCVCQVSDRFHDLVRDLSHLDAVEVVKLKRQGCPVRVTKSEWTSTQPRLTGASAGAQDIRPWMLRLWRDPELTAWCESNTVKQPASAPAAKVEDVPAPIVARAAPAKELFEAGPSDADRVRHLPPMNGKRKR